MKAETRTQREQQIEQAAYRLLEEKGYKATSMLAIAKLARASNETLYAWYGNKQTLFRNLIEKNAERVGRELETALQAPGGLEGALDRIGSLLLELVSGERAIILNRAAAADVNDTGTLGQTLAAAGRDTVLPSIARLFQRAIDDGTLVSVSSLEIAETYIGLLVGDLQVRRVIGAIDAPSKLDVNARAVRARELIVRLYRVTP